MTAEDFVGTLSGWDEIAIEKAFGEDFLTLRKRGTTMVRALVFVAFKRQGQKHDEAYRSAMDMPMSDLENYFAEEEPELDPSEPETDQGKGDTPSA
jgi:hypothetical protein